MDEFNGRAIRPAVGPVYSLSLIHISKKITAQNYPIIMLDNTKAADDAANANANASLHYDNGKATLTISFTGEAASGQTYTIHTPFTAVSSLYRIAPLPKLSEITIEGNTAKISGEQLSRFDTITLFAVNQHDETDVRRIGVEKKDDAGWNGGTVEAAIDLPADLPSGDYFIKAAASDLKATLYSDVQTPYTHTNDKQPLAPDVSAISAAGDYKVSFAVTPAGAINGYRVNIYDKDGNTVEGVSSKLYDSSGNTVSYDGGGLKAEIGSAPASLTAGGRFTGTERLEKIVDGVPVYDENGIAVYEDVPKTYGLTAGES